MLAENYKIQALTSDLNFINFFRHFAKCVEDFSGFLL